MVISVKATENFKKATNNLDNRYKIPIKNLIKKIINNPKIGKPMKNIRKGTRELYIKPFRLSYSYLESEDEIILLDLYHKKRQ